VRYEVRGGDVIPNDISLVAALRGILDHLCESERFSFVRTDRALLIGHSRGAKVSALAAVVDERVKGLCLLDPVDNTIWAPLSPGFPSACDALVNLARSGASRPLPVAIVGAGAGADCAPEGSNYKQFFDAARGPAWLTVLPSAGHAQFIDTGAMQRAVCSDAGIDDATVQLVAAAVCRALVEVSCGPLSDSATEVATRIETTKRVRQLTQPNQAQASQEGSISVGAAASTTADRLQSWGIEVESFVKLGSGSV